MKNEFLHALGTDKANKNTDLSLYAKFVRKDFWAFGYNITNYGNNATVWFGTFIF